MFKKMIAVAAAAALCLGASAQACGKFSCLTSPDSCRCVENKEKEFTVLQWNIWQEGSVVPGGFDAVVDEIVRLSPDFVTLSEVRNYNDVDFSKRLINALAERGETYYSFRSNDTGLLSRHQISNSLSVLKGKKIHGTVHRLETVLRRHKLAVYTAHLDYLNAANYDARGYDGNRFQPRELPRSVDEILQVNTNSQRMPVLSMPTANSIPTRWLIPVLPSRPTTLRWK